MQQELFHHIEYVYSFDLEPSDRISVFAIAQSPILLDKFSHKTTVRQRRQLEMTFKDQFPGNGLPDFRMLQGYKRLQKNTTLVIGSKRSQRYGDVSRCNYRICYQQSVGQQYHVGEVHFFAHTELGKWAWITELRGAAFDQHRGVASILNEGKSFWIPVDWIITVVGLLHHGGLKIVVSDVPEMF